MTKLDLLELLREECATHTQTRVAKMLGYSSGAISQVLSGTYGGDTSIILEKVEEIFGGVFVNCPTLGEIPLALCAEHRRRPPTTDSFYARMYRACQACERKHNGGKP